MRYKPPPDLLEMDPVADYKLALAKFSTMDMKRYRAFLNQMRESTNVELTDIENSHWAMVLMWLDKYDEYAVNTAIDDVPVRLRDQERKYRMEVLKMLERYRDKGPRTKSFLEQCQEFLIDIEGQEGDLKIEWKKKGVVDVDTTYPQAEEDET